MTEVSVHPSSFRLPSVPRWRVGLNDRGPSSTSHQTLQQELQLPHLRLHREVPVRHVVDGDRQQTVVMEPLELRDDSAILDLPLADANLQLARGPAGVAEVAVADVRIDLVEAASLMRAVDEVTRIERQAQIRHAFAELASPGRRL